MKTLSINYNTIKVSIAVIALLGSVSLFYLTSAEAATTAAPLKDAKLNIEHNATDLDTGFQGFVDSEGWKGLTFTGPKGKVLEINGLGSFAKLGVNRIIF